jgi:cytoskeletal protein CcmA (bactofilin family)
MRERPAVVALVCLTVLAAAAPAAALEMRAGPAARLAQTESVDDDLYLAGPYVSVDGQVRGDLIAAGGTVNIRGQTTGALMVAGGMIDVGGPVNAAIRAAGGTIFVRGTVGTDVVAVGGRVSVDPSARIGRDLAVAGGTVWFMGSAGRNAWITAANVEIGGTVAGNMMIRASEIKLLPTAVIRGNLTYSSEHPIQIAEGARVAGTVTREAYPVRPMPSRQAMRGFRIIFGIADFFWMLIVALVLIAVLPYGVQASADAVRMRPGASLGWGLVLLVLVPLIILAFIVTLLGIPVGVLVLVAHLLALFASHAATGLALGQLVAPRLQSPFAEAAIGIGIIAVATNLPYIGWVLRLLALAIGFGAVVLVIWQRRTRPAKPMPVGPAVA